MSHRQLDNANGGREGKRNETGKKSGEQKEEKNDADHEFGCFALFTAPRYSLIYCRFSLFYSLKRIVSSSRSI